MVVCGCPDEALSRYATGDSDAAAVFVRRFQDRGSARAVLTCDRARRGGRPGRHGARLALRRQLRPCRARQAGWLLTIVRNVALTICAHGWRPERLTPDLPAAALLDEIDAADIAAESGRRRTSSTPCERCPLSSVTPAGGHRAAQRRRVQLPANLPSARSRPAYASRRSCDEPGSGHQNVDRPRTLADDLAASSPERAALVLRHRRVPLLPGRGRPTQIAEAVPQCRPRPHPPA
jgi:hypothetical protein